MRKLPRNPLALKDHVINEGLCKDLLASGHSLGWETMEAMRAVVRANAAQDAAPGWSGSARSPVSRSSPCGDHPISQGEK